MTDRQQQSRRIVKRYMWFSAGGGLIPIPFLDWAAVTGLQLKMVAEISKIYEVPFHENAGKAAIASFAGFLVPHAASVGTIGTMVKAVPGLGGIAAGPMTAALAGAYAWALGNMFIQHFESGGTFLNFKPEQVREYFESRFEAEKTSPAAKV